MKNYSKSIYLSMIQQKVLWPATWPCAYSKPLFNINDFLTVKVSIFLIKLLVIYLSIYLTLSWRSYRCRRKEPRSHSSPQNRQIVVLHSYHGIFPDYRSTSIKKLLRSAINQSILMPELQPSVLGQIKTDLLNQLSLFLLLQIKCY